MDLATWEIAVLIVAGVGGGFINVIAGGGSVITVPVMIFLGVPGPVANGTNRLPILAQNITAALTYLRHGLPKSGMFLSLALCAIPGAVAGARHSALGKRLRRASKIPTLPFCAARNCAEFVQRNCAT